MAKTYNRLEIDVNKKPNSIGIRPVQNDTKSRYLDVCLYENGVAINLTGEQVRITFRKADGSTFFNQGEVTDATAGRCQFALTNEILSEAKAVEAQISVWNAGGQILSTQVFEIYVSAAIPWTDSVESENEFGVLVVLFQEIQDALDTMHKIATTFGEPGEKAAEYGVDTFWGILETLAGRGDVESALENKIKAYLNSTVGTSGFQPLDTLTSAKILLRGAKDTVFKFTHSVTGTVFTIIMDSETPIGSSGWRELSIPVSLGIWSVNISIAGIGTTNVNIDVAQLGVIYPISYTIQSNSVLSQITSNTTYSIPSDIEGVIVYACGGGGGGGGGYWNGGSSSSSKGDGAGGGGGAAIMQSKLLQYDRTLTVTIGTGGVGGVRNKAGSTGGSTILTGFLNCTLPGGGGGGVYSSSTTPGKGGTAGGAGGGAGGDGGTSSVSPKSGFEGLLGVGGSARLGGGGGGSLGAGGNGAKYTDASGKAENGVQGGGGGGGAATYSNNDCNVGGNGGDGIVFVYKGVSV